MPRNNPEYSYMKIERFPYRLKKALRVYAAMNELRGVQAAIIHILEHDMSLQRIQQQYIRDNARAEEIRKTSTEQLNRINKGDSNVR